MIPPVPLQLSDVPRVVLHSDSLFDRHSLGEHIRENPTRVWRNYHYEYVAAGLWKGRDEIGEILETGGPAPGLVRMFQPRGISWGTDPSWHERRAALVERLVQVFKANRTDLVLLSDREADHAGEFYLDIGWKPVEQIVYYRKPDSLMRIPSSHLRIELLRQRDLQRVLELERQTFPWMWWYSADEWGNVLYMPGVETTLAYLDNVLVGYETHTVRTERGHLDRLGMHPDVQGQGLGTELLSRALERMAALGAKSVGLSTQWNNWRSRQLYEKYGFALLPRTQTIYGLPLSDRCVALLAADNTCAP
jgi:ribosomal-protein-alanine N-acetyltransferase